MHCMSHAVAVLLACRCMGRTSAVFTVVLTRLDSKALTMLLKHMGIQEPDSIFCCFREREMQRVMLVPE
jgi:hypothetical protein